MDKGTRASGRRQGRHKRRKEQRRKNGRNSEVIYRGPSEIDGAPIIVIVTGLSKASSNPKTGDMLQVFILLQDVPPNVATKTGQDVSICGDCKLRPFLFKKGEVSNRRCYVKTFQAPLSTWKANKERDAIPLQAIAPLIAGRRLRRGAYGDPSAVPAYIWNEIDNPGTGYTHQWKEAEMQSFLMASVHSKEEKKRANDRGYRTFRIISALDEVGTDEILCPASKEAGARTSCAKCNLCNGKRDNDKRKSIAIIAH